MKAALRVLLALLVECVRGHGIFDQWVVITGELGTIDASSPVNEAGDLEWRGVLPIVQQVRSTA